MEEEGGVEVEVVDEGEGGVAVWGGGEEVVVVGGWEVEG